MDSFAAFINLIAGRRDNVEFLQIPHTEHISHHIIPLPGASRFVVQLVNKAEVRLCGCLASMLVLGAEHPATLYLSQHLDYLTRASLHNMSDNAPHPAIPSIEEILSSQNVLSAPDAMSKVFRVGKTLAVKFGGTTSPTEAATLEFLSRQTKIPVPKFYTSFSDPQTENHFIVMQYIEGDTLETALPTLSSREKLEVVVQIRDILLELRSLESPGYLGSVNRLPCEDGVFYDPETSPPISGPFSSEDELYANIIRRFERSEPASFVRLIRGLSEKMPRHETVFTHGDLQPKNILLQKYEAADGTQRCRVVLIDWEISGWYPAYWEFCNATIAGRFKPEWLGMVQDVFPASGFEYEFLYMELSVILCITEHL